MMKHFNVIRSVQRGQRPLQLLYALILGLGAVLALWLTLVALTKPVHADTLCVKPGGGGGCLSTISAALAAAQENDMIRVAAGVYNENLHISQTLTLQGGWSPDFAVRDSNAYVSVILPADNTQSVVSIQGQFAHPAAVAPTLDGFVITGGRADLGSSHGGGVRIVDSNATLISNTIQNNVAFLLGGGVWVQRGAPVLQGNDIHNNLTVGLGQDAHGGGVQLENTRATLLDNIFSGNMISGTEMYGGGLEIAGTGAGRVTIRRNQFISNTGLLDSGGKPEDFSFGGAIAVVNGDVMLQDSTLRDNISATGGGVFIGGDLEDCCNLTGQGNLIQANAALRGGGVYNDSQVVRIRGGLFISNTAVVNGGGFLIASGGNISLTNGAIIANLAGQDGGGIHNSGRISVSNTTVSGNSASGMGGGVANFNVVNLVNATVADNASADGAGFFNANVVDTVNSLIALNIGDNCLGVLNSLGHNLEDGGTCALGQPTDMSNTPPSMGSLGSNGGTTPTHALAGDSPAIDAGDNAACAAVDQRGAARPADGDDDGQAVCDIGAYEYGAVLPWLYLPVVLR